MKLHTAGTRLAISAAAGGLAAVGLAAVAPPGLAGIAGWIALAGTFSTWTWLAVGGLDAVDTRHHATREDPTHTMSRVVLVLASLASIAGVGVLLLSSADRSSVPWEALLGVASVAASWVLVHVLYMLHYARLYYSDDTGEAIGFNGEGDPDYHDFAYLAFTIGMTYQVSDTALTGREVRRAALRHALMSYLLGAVVLAVTINLVVQLASGGP